jgi:hypothetical protein
MTMAQHLACLVGLVSFAQIGPSASPRILRDPTCGVVPLGRLRFASAIRSMDSATIRRERCSIVVVSAGEQPISVQWRFINASRREGQIRIEKSIASLLSETSTW